MRKSEARAFFRQRRAEVTATQKAKWDDLLLIQFQQAPIPLVTNLLSYYPAEDKGEADSFLITRYLLFCNPGLQVSFPRISAEATMQAVLPEAEDDFAPNAFNIPEPVGGTVIAPEDIDLVLIPLLCFDEQGHRVGYGKGYYDRFLVRCRPGCIKAGISYFGPIAHIDDASHYDVPLDLCITPEKVYVF